ncbi:methylated-DNA--[protein]-cysteine S-methyltransferase [Dongia rigui]|uniref:Methylated-DNA--protein-cysteine methyltransferase n=1 Tax=Dongia rigui TaxID=940149 RepID=A0ABU5E3M8_9PROT|nr:methylated-DNA--[protein]-cysteine S-methyltransferase [Dongia rigui]MDY0873937.1 methylated-DNA--[protein]-cysteine S-methyltransferase [Dongia rigui]
MAEPLALKIDRFATPIGELILIVDAQDRLRAIDWHDHEDRMLKLLGRYCGKAGFTLTLAKDPGGLRSALQAYFKGDLKAIDKLVTDTGGTDFQRRIWRELRRIPCGKTISYAELARRIGKPAAMRAAGLANGANPVSIVIPCHRVIGSDGSLTGYGGGLHRKQWLLAHENAIAR